MRCSSSRAARPGGTAKVVAECSTIAGPWIVLPAHDLLELEDVGLHVLAFARAAPDRAACLQRRRALDLLRSSGSAGFSTSTVPWTIAWVTR